MCSFDVCFALVVELPEPPGVLAIAADDTNVYFSGANGVFQAPGGTLGNTTPLGLVTWTSDQAERIAVDGGFVYYAYFATSSTSYDISRVPIDGGTVEPLVTGSSWVRAMILGGSSLYYSNDAGIHVLPKAGGSATTIHADPRADAIAVDSSYLFFQDSSCDVNTTCVFRVPIGGGTAIELARDADFAGLFQDSTSLYWLGVQAGIWELRTVPKSGAQAASTLRTALDEPFASTQAVPIFDGAFIYYFTRNTGLRRLAIDGSSDEQVFNNFGAGGVGPAASSTELFWAGGNAGEDLYKTDK